MKKKYPYARWVADKLRWYPKEKLQEMRGVYYSTSGKIAHYDEYAKWCRELGYDYDDSPEGYWDSKVRDWHNPLGILMGLSGILMWFVATIIGSSTGQIKR
jgi:hypothetical protein